jgi:hypothetical protein
MVDQLHCRNSFLNYSFQGGHTLWSINSIVAIVFYSYGGL